MKLMDWIGHGPVRVGFDQRGGAVTGLSVQANATGISLAPGVTLGLADATTAGLLSPSDRTRLGGLQNVAELAATTFADPDVTHLEIAGYAAPGDGGGGQYRRVTTEPTHEGKVQSIDGAWWELQPENGAARPQQFGAQIDGITDDTAAVQAAIGFVEEKGLVLDWRDAGQSTARVGGLTVTGDVIWIGDGAKLKAPGSDVTLASPLSHVNVRGLSFEDYAVGFDLTGAAPDSEMRFSGGAARNCGIIYTALGIRRDFQAFIMADTNTARIECLMVHDFIFEGGDFAIAYRGPFGLAQVSRCKFTGQRRMGAMLGFQNNGDFTPFEQIAVDGCSFTNIVSDNPAEFEIHAVLAYGVHVRLTNCRCDGCWDIHPTIHDSEAFNVRADSGELSNISVRNGGRGDGCISLKLADEILISNCAVLTDASWAATFGRPTGFFCDGISKRGRFTLSNCQVCGTFDRGVLLNGTGAVANCRIEGDFSIGFLGTLDDSTGSQPGSKEFTLSNLTIIQEGIGSTGINIRVLEGNIIDYVGISDCVIRLSGTGAFTAGGQAMIQLEPNQVLSGQRNTIVHADIHGNTLMGRVGSNPSALLVSTNVGSGGTGGSVERVTFKGNDTDLCDNILRLSTLTVGDVGLANFEGGLHTNVQNRLLSNPTLATSFHCFGARGTRPSETFGNATIGAVNTSVTVATGLQDTLRPVSAESISIIPTSNCGSAAHWWISDVTGGTFTLNLDSAPGIPFTFNWRARNRYHG